MRRKRIIPMVAAVILAAFLTSCNEEENPSTIDSRYIYFSVNTKDAVETKSSADIQTSETIELSGDGQSLFITTSRSINDDNPFEGGLTTKGAEKTAADVVEGFTMHMISDASNSLYKTGIVEQRGDRSIYPYWSFYDGDDKIDWPEDAENGTKYSFLSCISADNVAISNYSYADRKVDYTGMSHASNSVDDATKSQDLLVAYTAGVQHDHAAQNQVKLNFYHPLAAIKFNVSKKVKKIALTSIRKSGTIQYNSVDPSDDDDFKKAFTWTISSSDDNLTEYVQKVYDSDIDESTGYAVYEFFLIPHDFSKENVKLTFDVEGSDGQIHQISTLANNLGITTWESGYRYNYYIDEASVRKIGVEVSENFVNYVKSNVGVQNVKRSTAYVRAVVVANWATEKGKILSSFNGTINYNTSGSSNWVEGDDGYWYYKKPLVGYSTTEPLINSFEDTTKSSELNFQLNKYRLVWQILVEGVEFDDEKKYVGEAWPDVTVNGTSLTSVLEVE